MMGMGHYRGGGVGRIKGLVSLAEASDTSPSPFMQGEITLTPRGNGQGRSGWGGVELTRRIGSSRLPSARPFDAQEAHLQHLRPIEEEGTGPLPRFLAEPRNDRERGEGEFGKGRLRNCEPLLMGRLGKPCSTPPAHTSRASARAAPGPGARHSHWLLLVEEEGTGPFPRFLAEPRNDRRMGVGIWGIG